MNKDKKAITIRVPSDLKFQIDKAVLEDGFATINSWIIHLIKNRLDGVKK